jgi:hypothetical protein
MLTLFVVFPVHVATAYLFGQMWGGGMIARSVALILAALVPLRAEAQISPGKLARAHHDLEGIGKCTSCHPYGKTLSNDKCLDCHKEIKAALDSTRGFHAHIAGKRCAECHSDHNGEEFQIVRLDTTKFDHRTTAGFPLNGKHADIVCDSCHSWSRVAAPDVRMLQGKRSQTLLGLSPSCVSCHPDIHRNQFSIPCSSCHDTKGWKPVRLFSHDHTRYPLTGKHRQVECAGCHHATVDHSKAVLYRGMEFSTCASCHPDPHMKKFTRRCDECHSTGDWKTSKGGAFDHQRTDFPLNGKHANVTCLACHAPAPRAVNASGEKGFHISRFHLCAECHEDAHGGQFAARSDGGKCEACHTDKDFTLIFYTVESHLQSRYPLTGAHIATNCIACHKPDIIKAKSTRQFRWEKNLTCSTCHPDPHKDQFTRENKNCESCHLTESWSSLLFDHSKSAFPLEGRHSTVQCVKCHGKGDPVQYAGLTTVCAPCHKDPHFGQFVKGGATRCEPCHNAQSWKRITFDHSTGSRFALRGAHADVKCAKCHPTESRDARQVVRYKPLRVACEDCHKPNLHETTH